MARTTEPGVAWSRVSRPDPGDEITLDIIMPAHDEAHRIGPTLHAYRRGFAHSSVRFIVALDGCQDATGDIVRRHADEDPRVELLAFSKLGKGGVIRQAINRSRGELVAFVDADGSIAPEELGQLVDAARHADGAIASRRLADSSILGRRPPTRTAASGVFAWLVRRLFGLPYTDTTCGAKVIRREALSRFLPRVTTTDLVFDVDLLLQADHAGYRFMEVPTVWTERTGSRVNLARDFWPVARSLLRLWKDDRRIQSAALAGQLQWDRGAS